MSAANPLPELDEIPLTDRHWRERWAQELTRANELEKRLREAERSAADWQCIALSNGEQLAHVQVELARERESHRLTRDAATKANDAWVARSQANFARADKLAEYIQWGWDAEGINAETEHVRDIIKRAGVACPEDCHDGYVYEDDGSEDGYDGVRTECSTCFGVGKVLR